MGLAKYYEDDLEIIYERQAVMQSQNQDTEIKVICTSVTPATKIGVELKKDSHESQEKYEDRYIFCRDCGRVFTFSAGAQKHYKRKGWNEPKRCKCCRDRRNIRYLMCSSF